MKKTIYFIQFCFIYFFFIICRILGYKKASDFGSYFAKFIGPLFRSKKIINENIKRAFPKTNKYELNNINKKIWENYGRILSDYNFLKDFRSNKLGEFIHIDGEDILEKIKYNNKPVIFVSGHFNNFELLALILEKSGINLAALYRPLNNIFLNKIMLKLRKNYICKNQVPKGISGVKSLLNYFNKGLSIALMIDQRVSQGIKVKFFNVDAFTTTIPAQFFKKFNCQIVPVHIKRYDNYYFEIKIDKPFTFQKSINREDLTLILNQWLEKKIILNPEQWIWTHNRWK